MEYYQSNKYKLSPICMNLLFVPIWLRRCFLLAGFKHWETQRQNGRSARWGKNSSLCIDKAGDIFYIFFLGSTFMANTSIWTIVVLVHMNWMISRKVMNTHSNNNIRDTIWAYVSLLREQYGTRNLHCTKNICTLQSRLGQGCNECVTTKPTLEYSSNPPSYTLLCSQLSSPNPGKPI